MERKIHLINWEVVCTQKVKGGLGIRKIDLLNKALLSKWIWRFAFEEGTLWKKVIGVKYGQEGLGWRTNEARGAFGVGVWKEILKEANWCWDNIRFKVGKGTRVNFWTDHWCGDEALSRIFPQLFALAVHKNATISEVWDSSLGQGGWNLRFARDSNDWELVVIEALFNMLREFKLSQEEDSVVWRGGGQGKFGVSCAYNLLAAPNSLEFPVRCIWVDKVPTKAAFFAWEATWGRSLPWIGSKEEGGSFLIAVFCVVVKRKMYITFFYTVQWLGFFGILSLPCLGFIGCSQRRS
ncbi:putative ribonuclease H protein [Vitis vinifera]|uniref:Putative ribonuclease H protein n=1 Tax=Vitis vinifera TaxID=29760 RepID=A0A438C1X4_VITVI|nr:putative ribonuclease H protein [Vitis vinifera]RVX16356.1 putative ribonuclease H protein [Vitis vinifera]